MRLLSTFKTLNPPRVGDYAFGDSLPTRWNMCAMLTFALVTHFNGSGHILTCWEEVMQEGGGGWEKARPLVTKFLSLQP